MSIESDAIAPVIQALREFEASNERRMEESVAEVRAMMNFEDQSWLKLVGGYVNGDRLEGLDLDEVKTISEKARTRVAISGLDKRALRLHTGYVFSKGVTFEGTQRPEGSKGTLPAKVRFFNNPVNQAELFSDEAKATLQSTRFTDGTVIALCDKPSGTVRIIPISQIDNLLISDEFPGEVWAYRRTWTPRGATKERSEWIYTSRYTGRVQKTIGEGNARVPVRQDARIVDLRANRQSGWTLGIPDATAGMLWAEAYGQVLQYGQIVNESLSKIIFKVVSKSAKGAQNAGVKFSGAAGYGGAASMADGQDIQMVNSSMRSFDFAAARPLAAMAASAWSVANIDLLSDSSAAGSSYGSAQALTDGVRNDMLSMQRQWTRFYQDIFRTMDLGETEVHWEPMETMDPYRESQRLSLLSPALSDEEFRGEVLRLLDINGVPSEIPPSLLNRNETPQTQASPDQGRSNGTGGTDSGAANDLRSDNIN